MCRLHVDELLTEIDDWGEQVLCVDTGYYAVISLHQAGGREITPGGLDCERGDNWRGQVTIKGSTFLLYLPSLCESVITKTSQSQSKQIPAGPCRPDQQSGKFVSLRGWLSINGTQNTETFPSPRPTNPQSFAGFVSPNHL